MDSKEKPRVEDHLALAMKIASGRVSAQERHNICDTIEYSDALVGLMKACNTYDPNKKNKDGQPYQFSTYAWRCMEYEMNACRRYRKRKEMLDSTLLSEMNGKDCDGVFEIPEKKDSSIPVHLIDVFLKEKKTDTERQKRCKKILRHYYVDGMTYKEIGEKYNVCRERIRQLIECGIKLIREQYSLEISDEKQ